MVLFALVLLGADFFTVFFSDLVVLLVLPVLGLADLAFFIGSFFSPDFFVLGLVDDIVFKCVSFFNKGKCSLSSGFSIGVTEVSKTSAESHAISLTDDGNQLWQGSISVGTPPHLYTGVFFCVS